MLQIRLDHLVRHLPCRGTEVPSRPKVSSPEPFLQMRVLFKQPTRRPTLDSPHDLARGHRRWATHQYVNVVPAHHSFHYPDLKRFTRLSHQCPYSFRHFARQYLVAVLSHLHKMVLNLVHRVASIPVVHAASSSCMRLILAAKAGGFNLVMDNK